MNKYLLLIIVSFLAIGLLSCGKDREDLLRGTWERVNVEDINDPYSYEWVFDLGEVTIYRRLKENPSDVAQINHGFYLLETTPVKTTLKLIDTSNTTWNDRWDVITLNNNHLIIKLDIVGGVLYFEFEKKSSEI